MAHGCRASYSCNSRILQPTIKFFINYIIEDILKQARHITEDSSIDTHPRKKRVSKAQTDPLIINGENPSHETVSDYSYVHESILEDAPMFEMIPENNEISIDYESAYELIERSSIHIDDVFA